MASDIGTPWLPRGKENGHGWLRTRHGDQTRAPVLSPLDMSHGLLISLSVSCCIPFKTRSHTIENTDFVPSLRLFKIFQQLPKTFLAWHPGPLELCPQHDFLALHFFPLFLPTHPTFQLDRTSYGFLNTP